MDTPSESSPENDSSGVGVIDKAALVMGALESGPATLAQLVSTTHLARPTAHRIAVALEFHRLVTRDSQGRFILGPRLTELASAAGEDHLLSAAGPVLAALRDKTHESAQLYRRQGDVRICVANAERRSGCVTPFQWAPPCPCRAARQPRYSSPGRSPTACTAAWWGPVSLPPCSRRSDVGDGLSRSGEREPGVASVSARYAVPAARWWPRSRYPAP